MDGIPKGWKPVPIDCTDEMMQAGYEVMRDMPHGPFGYSPSLGHSLKVFEAMLSAAPQPVKTEPLTDTKVKEAIRAEIESLKSSIWYENEARFAIASLEDLCYRLGVTL